MSSLLSMAPVRQQQGPPTAVKNKLTGNCPGWRRCTHRHTGTRNSQEHTSTMRGRATSAGHRKGSGVMGQPKQCEVVAQTTATVTAAQHHSQSHVSCSSTVAEHTVTH